MITSIVKKYLADNAALKALLGATAEDSKLYYGTAHRGMPLPKIAFWAASPDKIDATGVLYAQIYTFEVYAKTKSEIQDIHSVLLDALDVEDKAQLKIGGDGERLLILESHLDSTFSSQNFELDTENNLLEPLSFRFQYRRCKQGA